MLPANCTENCWPKSLALTCDGASPGSFESQPDRDTSPETVMLSPCAVGSTAKLAANTAETAAPATSRRTATLCMDSPESPRTSAILTEHLLLRKSLDRPAPSSQALRTASRH